MRRKTGNPLRQRVLTLISVERGRGSDKFLKKFMGCAKREIVFKQVFRNMKGFLGVRIKIPIVGSNDDIGGVTP